MNDSLRWLLVLGCLCIVCLEAPQDLLQIFQDCSGAYPAQRESAAFRASAETSTLALRADVGGERSSGESAPSTAMVASSTGRVVSSPRAAARGSDGSMAHDWTADPAGSRPHTLVTDTHPGWEEDRAHEPRGDRIELRAESADGR